MSRKTSFTAVLIIVIAAISLITSCSSKEQKKTETITGIVTFAVGNTEILRAGVPAAPAKLMDKIAQGDSLSTGAGSIITIQIGTDSVIRIQPDTKVTFTSLLAEKGNELFLEKGQILSKVERIKKDDSFRIKTPTAVAAVRGTEFSASFINGRSVVAVKEGKVAVAPKSADVPAGAPEAPIAEPVIIEKGNTAVLAKAEAPADAAAAPVPAKIEVRAISKSESLVVEKISIVQLIAEPEKKTEAELIKIQEPVTVEDKKIDAQIAPLAVQEKIEKIISQKSASIEEIKSVYNRIDEITLYNRKVVRGAIISRGATYKVLTTNGSLSISEKEIKSVKVIQ